jgi:hypothetical protein
MARTTSTQVAAVLLNDYDNAAQPDLTPYIDSASSMVDAILNCASQRGLPLSSTQQEIVERWLSAYFYTRTDPIYASKTTAGASGNFVSDPELGPERYKQAAIQLDPSGCLNAFLNRRFATQAWLGKNPTSQIDYVDRR